MLVNQHFKTKSYYQDIILDKTDFSKGDILTLDIRNFMIKLSMSDGTEKTIIPKFTKTKIGSKIKNGCKLSILKNDIDHYVVQVEILEELQAKTDEILFSTSELDFTTFIGLYDAFVMSMLQKQLNRSIYTYYDINKRFNIIKLFS